MVDNQRCYHPLPRTSIDNLLVVVVVVAVLLLLLASLLAILEPELAAQTRRRRVHPLPRAFEIGLEFDQTCRGNSEQGISGLPGQSTGSKAVMHASVTACHGEDRLARYNSVKIN